MSNKLLSAFFIFSTGVLATIFLQSLIYPKQFYVARLPDGSVYDGELVDEKFNGQGKLLWPDYSTYEGEFENGQFHGKGKITKYRSFSYEGDFIRGEMTGFGILSYSKDRTYTGEIKDGLMNGKGKLNFKGAIYEGGFRDDEFHGQGKLTYEYGAEYEGEFDTGALLKGSFSDKEGTKYQGDFKDWSYHGDGTLTNAEGEKYVGNFSYGILTGNGEHFKKDGTYYKGKFEYGEYQGFGRLELKNGDVYEGEFSYGRYNGKGKIEYSSPVDGLSGRSGTWKYGKLIESDDGVPIISPKSLNEIALYNQDKLLSENSTALENNDPNEVELYFLGISGDGSQAVFRREIQFVQALFKSKFKTGGKSTVLINSRETVEEAPLATTTSIRQTINEIANKMDVSEDILFIYMTSHGSKKATFTIRQPEMGLPDLSADTLSEILKSTPIKWKVIVISACYSGKFIQPLKDDYTLIITASDEDKKSFGCSDESEFTYFGDAYFNQALNRTSDFIEAFDLAISFIESKEKAKNYKSSEPQIHKPQAIIKQLKKWRSSLGESK